MPFIVRHVRLTNSGKIPDVFLSSKIQTSTDITDQGKLFFVLQIDCPWNAVASIGSSIINIIGREYYRHEGNVPLENFERALAKANRLIEQLAKEGETSCIEHLHALVGLAVGDEFHLSYTGSAEAYFLRDEKLRLMTEPGSQKTETGHLFTNFISGEVSASDVVILASPLLYGAFTTDELQLILKQPLAEAARSIARRLKTLKLNKVNAIILHFDTVANVENTPLAPHVETIYLDQPIDSTWNILRYWAGKIGQPLGKAALVGGSWLGARSLQVWQGAKQTTAKVIVPKAKELASRTGKTGAEAVSSLSQKALPKLRQVGLAKLAMSRTRPIYGSSDLKAGGVKVHHYSDRRHSRARYQLLAATFGHLAKELKRQLQLSFARSPRTWYIVIALVLLASIGTSVQVRKNRSQTNPAITTALLEEMEQKVKEANEAKVFGNNDKARTLLADVVAKAELAKQNPRLAAQASTLLGTAERELDRLAGSTHLSASNPLIRLPVEATAAIITEGTIYFTTADGKLQSMLLTGTTPTQLAQLPEDQAVNQLALDPANRILYLQSYTGELYQYRSETKKLTLAQLVEGRFPVATGTGLFSGTLYLLAPAESQIWKYTGEDSQFAKAAAYLKSKKVSLIDGIDMAIDGSIFVLHRTGEVTKFTRGTVADFKLTGLPSPFDSLKQPLRFFAVEDGASYYLADKGTDTIPSRIIEFDKAGKFLHQFFFPRKWQKDLKLIIANPKTHRAWVLVNNDLYEFTLVQ